MQRTKFTVTLEVETEWPAALDVLLAAWRNPAELLRTKRRFDICLERAVNTADAPTAWRYVVTGIKIESRGE